MLLTAVRAFLTPVLLLWVTLAPLGAEAAGALDHPGAKSVSDKPSAELQVAGTATTAELEPDNACCAAACIGGGKCGIYCEEISAADPCESKYRFDCPETEALICQGGSCICAQ